MRIVRQLILLWAFLIVDTVKIYGQEKGQATLVAVEVLPEFPGGLDSLMIFIGKNLKSSQGNITDTGTVIVGFTIEVNGTVTDLEIIEGLCKPCDKSALEVFKKMPRWTPGTIDGKPAKMRMAFPITFE